MAEADANRIIIGEVSGVNLIIEKPERVRQPLSPQYGCPRREVEVAIAGIESCRES